MPDTLPNCRATFNVLFIVRFFTRISLDTYMSYQYVSAYFFLVRLKEEVQGSLTPYNKLIIAVSMTMLGFFMTKAYLSNICFSLLNITYFHFEPRTRVVLRFFTNPVHWTLEFLIFCGLMYIFDYQGRRMSQKKERAVSCTSLVRFSPVQE
jgi:hypothetical protein